MRKVIYTLSFLVFLTTSCNQKRDNIKTFDSAFAHTVYFWFKSPDNQEQRKIFEASLEKFLMSSKYAKTNFIGIPPKALRDVVDGSFTYSLIVTFESAEAQQKYQEEQAHLIFIEECKDFWDKVIVYDSKSI